MPREQGLSSEEMGIGKEYSDEAAMERAIELIPSLRKLHDFAEDRSVMENQEIADLIANQFSKAGLEVFSDFADKLKEAKARQNSKEGK